MPFYVVLDTCVLLPMPLRDTLLTLAAEELYVPKWAGRSLDSMHELLQSRLGRAQAEADHVRGTIRTYFTDAEVPDNHVAALEPAMSNAIDDRYVFAAAVASGAELIVTDNVQDFPPEACGPHGVAAVSSDEFLLDLLDHHPDAVCRALELQAARLTSPPLDVDDVLDRLEAGSPGTPGFAAAVRGLRAASGS